MAEVSSYPTQEDIKVMKTAVSVFLSTRNGASRNVMHGVLKVMLDRYGVDKISLPGYIIERGRQGGARIIPRIYTESRECPKCGSSIYQHESVTIY